MAQPPDGTPEPMQAIVDRLGEAVANEDILFVLLELTYLRTHPKTSIDTHHSRTGLTALETAVQLKTSKRTPWIVKILLLSGASLPCDGPHGRFSGSSDAALKGEVEVLLRVWERSGEEHREFDECKKKLMGVSLQEAEAWLCEEGLEPDGLEGEEGEIVEKSTEIKVVRPTFGSMEVAASPTSGTPISPTIDQSSNRTAVTEIAIKGLYSTAPERKVRFVDPPASSPPPPSTSHPPTSHSSLMMEVLWRFPPIFRVKFRGLAQNTTRMEFQRLILQFHRIPSSSFYNNYVHTLSDSPWAHNSVAVGFVDFTSLDAAKEVLAYYANGARCKLAAEGRHTFSVEPVPSPRLVLSNLSLAITSSKPTLVLDLRKVLNAACFVDWGYSSAGNYAVVSVTTEEHYDKVVRYLEEDRMEMRGVQWERLPGLSDDSYMPGVSRTANRWAPKSGSNRIEVKRSWGVKRGREEGESVWERLDTVKQRKDEDMLSKNPRTRFA